MIAMGLGFAGGTASPVSTILLHGDFENGLSGWQISATPPNQAIVHTFALSDGFEGGFGTCTLTGNAMTTSSPVFEGGTALLLDYQSNYTSASRRFAGTAMQCNGDMGPAEVRQYCVLEKTGKGLLRSAMP